MPTIVVTSPTEAASVFSFAKPLVVLSALAFEEQNLHALRHVDSQEDVGVADNGRRGCQQGRLEDGVFGEIFLSKFLD